MTISRSDATLIAGIALRYSGQTTATVAATLQVLNPIHDAAPLPLAAILDDPDDLRFLRNVDGLINTWDAQDGPDPDFQLDLPKDPSRRGSHVFRAVVQTAIKDRPNDWAHAFDAWASTVTDTWIGRVVREAFLDPRPDLARPGLVRATSPRLAPDNPWAKVPIPRDDPADPGQGRR